jgi:hypothetical protein
MVDLFILDIINVGLLLLLLIHSIEHIIDIKEKSRIIPLSSGIRANILQALVRY